MMNHLKLDMWQSKGTSSLDPNLDQIWLGEGKEREGEATERKEREKERSQIDSVYLLSRFFGDQSVESRRDKRQS